MFQHTDGGEIDVADEHMASTSGVPWSTGEGRYVGALVGHACT